MRSVSDHLHGLLKVTRSDLIQRQRKQDRNGESGDQGVEADADRILIRSQKLGIRRMLRSV